MGQIVTIGTAKDSERLRERLFAEAQGLNHKGLELKLTTQETKSIYFIGLTLVSPEEKKAYQRRQSLVLQAALARTISEFIVDDLEAGILNRLVEQQKEQFNLAEQKQILLRAERFLELTDCFWSLENTGNMETMDFVNHRQRRIQQQITEYLSGNNELVVDGFLRFRLKQYLDQLQNAVDAAIDELLMEKEHQEFIQLLRYFVELQEPQTSQVHVIIPASGPFQIFDAQGTQMEQEYMESFFIDVLHSDLNYEDVLVGALIVIAPQFITLHIAAEDRTWESLQTIESVFAGKVSVCQGCTRCQGN